MSVCGDGGATTRDLGSQSEQHWHASPVHTRWAHYVPRQRLLSLSKRSIVTTSGCKSRGWRRGSGEKGVPSVRAADADPETDVGESGSQSQWHSLPSSPLVLHQAHALLRPSVSTLFPHFREMKVASVVRMQSVRPVDQSVAIWSGSGEQRVMQLKLLKGY